MYRINFIFILVLLVSCSKSSETRVRKTKKVTGINKPLSSRVFKKDTILYINQIRYFSEANEFYVALNFSKPFNNDIFDSLSKKTDSVIFDDGDISRHRLPIQIAENAFNINQLDKVNIYTNHHRFITSAKLKRVEYLDGLINSYFIAVFTPDTKVKEVTGSFYCLGGGAVDLKEITWQTIQDDKLTNTIKKNLNINPQNLWQVKHLKVMPYNSVYSIFAFEKEGGGGISYLTEYKDNRVVILNEYKQEVAFNDFYPLPIEQKGKPVLLINIILPESGAVDEFIVATFDGFKYKLENDNRISLN